MNNNINTYFDIPMEHTIDYDRIKEAIHYITEHQKEQPSLDEVASHIHLSPHHFQKLFKKWAGVSPKKYLQFLTLHHAKRLLRREHTLFDVSDETGLSGTGRLHDLFVNIEAMTPGEYKNEGAGLKIYCNSYDTLFGTVVIGNTQKGICHVAFTDEDSILTMTTKFSNAQVFQGRDQSHQDIVKYINGAHIDRRLKLHIKGTAFQLQVWHALLQIREGQLLTYGVISNMINSPKASRAVGTAIGANPIAYIIPCHRVIQSTGTIGGYRWGPERKRLIIGWESAQQSLKAS